MKKNISLVLTLCLGLLIPGFMTRSAAAASSREDLQDRIDAAKVVLDEILNTPDNTIPLNILKQATCVVGSKQD